MPSEHIMILSVDDEPSEFAEDLAIPNEALQNPCQVMLKSNVLEMANSSLGTAIWMLFYYMRSDLLGGEVAAYLIKTPLMGLVPNMLGCGISYYAEQIRASYIRDEEVRNRHARHYAKANFYIYALIDFIYQPMLDCIHSMLSQSWEMFADSTFELPEVLLNVVFNLCGITILHYYLTKWIRGEQFAKWNESMIVGPQYFCFYGVDYPLGIMAERYDLSDETVDYVGSTIGTGLGTLVVNMLSDSAHHCYSGRKRFANDRTHLLTSLSASANYGTDTEVRPVEASHANAMVERSSSRSPSSHTSSFFKPAVLILDAPDFPVKTSSRRFKSCLNRS